MIGVVRVLIIPFALNLDRGYVMIAILARAERNRDAS